MSWLLSDEEIRTRQRAEKERADRAFLEGYLVNVSSRKVVRLLKGLREVRDGLRGLLVDGNLYWWDPALGTHTDGYRRLFPDQNKRFSGLTFRNDHEVELHVDKNGVVYVTAHRSIWEKLKQHPNFDKRWF